MRLNKFLSAAILTMVAVQVYAEETSKPAVSHEQAEMLKSRDPVLARNKRVVYDLWRVTIAAGQVNLAPRYVATDFVDHNPNVPPGLKGYMQILSAVLKPIAIPASIKGLKEVVAEKDLVVLIFENEWSEAATRSPMHDEPNSFEMFRVKNGKVTEHWDSMPRVPKKAADTPATIPR